MARYPCSLHCMVSASPPEDDEANLFLLLASKEVSLLCRPASWGHSEFCGCCWQVRQHGKMTLGSMRT